MCLRFFFLGWLVLVSRGETIGAEEVAVDVSPTRSELLLNGEWGFAAEGEGAPENLPATIQVPGSWSVYKHHPLYAGVSAPKLERGVYTKSVEIPESWAGRRVVLDLSRVSTGATVLVNGQDCGRVEWPYGEVEITKAVQPGQAAKIEIDVEAVTPEGEDWALMGYLNEKKKKRKLASRGLIGDVLLKAEPKGARITDVFVKPSVREKKLDLEVEMVEAKPGLWEFTARLLDESGKEEKVLTTSAEVPAGDPAKLELSFPWEDPRLWGIEQPNLYTLHLEAKPAGVASPVDVYPQLFGFREFWIEGRDFYLNGEKVRFRPRRGMDSLTHPAEIQGYIEGTREIGFNISQIWPNDMFRPGQWHFWELFAEEASKAGWPIIGGAPSFVDIAMEQVDGVPLWTAKPEAREVWIEKMERDLKRHRNYPSILMWGTSGNLNAHFADQNPRYLGQKEKLLAHPVWPDKEKVGLEGMAAIREADPTRPVYMHASSRLGDVFTVNHYLNLLPLQEREEMLSEYLQTGDVPYIGIEFGTPLNTTMNRGRDGFSPSHKSEPFTTEYAAIYQGPAAYEKEPRAYRRNVRFGYNGQDWAGDWGQMQWIQSYGAPFQELQELFLRNTWRSWRASGVTGGMIPWNDNNQSFLNRDQSKTVPAPAPQPGQRGMRPEQLRASNLAHLKKEGGWMEKNAAKTLREVNGPSLSFLGGPAPSKEDPVAFTAKDHNFWGEQEVTKSAVLINDTHQRQPYEVKWTATVDGKEIASGEKNGEIATAENQFIPLAFTTPKLEAGVKSDGKITLTASIGEDEFTDEFPFRVFGKPKPITGLLPVVFFDPEGQTMDQLKRLGVTGKEWDGSPSKSLLIVGRNALAKHQLPGELNAFVKSGGRALIFAQDPNFMRDTMGLRVAQHVSRRVFPVSEGLAVMQGLDAEDLRDWSGAGSLVEAKPTYTLDAHPTYGWRWGNRGSVSSAMMEKPHRSGWRPLLQGEFDLAYSPLMELDAGEGKAILCTLDVEGRDDPAAEWLLRNLLVYAGESPLIPARTTVFLGSEKDYEFITKDLGVIAEKVDKLPTGKELVIVGPEAEVSAHELEQYAHGGGHVVILAQQAPGEPGLMGGDQIKAKSFHGARKAPTSDVAVGLGVSDVRFRSDLDWTTFDESPETDAAGLLHVQKVGKGLIIQAQFEPRWFDVKKHPMFRLTRWRHTRALAQILANQGARFQADGQTLDPQIRKLRLAGPWKVKFMHPLPNRTWNNPHADPGISEEAKAAVEPDFDDSSWEEWRLPSWYPPLEDQNGEVVWRKTIDVPAEWEGKILRLGAGRVKSFDSTFLNGKRVGKTGESVKNAWNLARRYRISGSQVKGGKAVIAIRQFAPDKQGGVHGRPEEMFLMPVAAGAKQDELYHSDYRQDFKFGDNPYRYYRW